MIYHDEPWVQIAYLNDHNQIYFTEEFREIMGELGWEAKAFTGHLLGLWYDPFEHMLDYASAGASGYVLKRVATEDLVQAIREVHSGASFLYPPIAAKLIDDYRRLARGDARPDTVGGLTPREREVLRLIAEGNTNQDIADILGLSRKTVESHRGNIMRKLQLHDVTDLVKYAIREGVVRLQ
ncbi:MAG: response regulator transcription factor [Anaerolineales bacterium]